MILHTTKRCMRAIGRPLRCGSPAGRITITILLTVLLLDWFLAIRPLKREEAVLKASRIQCTKDQFLKSAPRPTSISSNQITYFFHRFDVESGGDLLAATFFYGELPPWGAVEITITFGGEPSVIQKTERAAEFGSGARSSFSSSSGSPQD